MGTNNPGNSHLAFLVDDLRAAYEELSAKGVKFKSEPVEIDYGENDGAWGIYLEDPDGITMELFQPVPVTADMNSLSTYQKRRATEANSSRLAATWRSWGY